MLNNKSYQHKKNSGFTLIELLIAIAIFAVLSFSAYQILQGVLRSGQISKEHDQNLVEIQRGMLLIERDFVQMVARNSRTGNTDDADLQVLYTGQNTLDSDYQGIEFNRVGWANPLNLLPRSNILRVGYRVQEGQLQRLYYLHPDTVSGEEPEQQVILHDIENLTFRFWDDDWVSSWNSSSEIPTGIEMTITSKHYGELKRVFILPNSVVGD
ncbi:type II secretion system minor pseudopilin GspJ [uncultured Psychromonas sp.]|uniref:type II secretion system minor pseudopilin GspJ n=1 Tax=uncultured Psychromonas sp. TaxID=173974 RepID=UPI00262E27C4|nr:type II secretion system minor pseudopilin GspJ [uncultured Psychromonas sp.]